MAPPHTLQTHTTCFKTTAIRDTTFPIKLVANSNNCVDSIIQDVTVYTLPKTSFEISNHAGCAPLPVIFYNNTEAANHYAWDFGDGTLDTVFHTNTIQHIFQNEVTMNPSDDPVLERVVRLTAFNDHCDVSLARNIQVYPEVLSAFSAPDTADCNPFVVQFTNNSKNANYYRWDFGDQITSGVLHPNHFFFNYTTEVIQAYTTQLITKSKYDCLDTSNLGITVYPSPIAEFSVIPSHQYFPDTSISLNNQTQHYNGPWDFLWDYDDGNTSTQKEPVSHSFSTWDTFDITLHTWSYQCSDSITHRVIVLPPVPIPVFSPSVDSGCVPLIVQFSNQSLYGTTYEWDFDNGDKKPTGVTLLHILQTPYIQCKINSNRTGRDQT